MSNNKQSSVEWLISELGEYFPHEIGGIHLMVSKAKAMHKEEIEHSYLTCYEEYTAEGKHWEMGMNPKETFEQYYNETYNK